MLGWELPHFWKGPWRGSQGWSPNDLAKNLPEKKLTLIQKLRILLGGFMHKPQTLWFSFTQSTVEKKPTHALGMNPF